MALKFLKSGFVPFIAGVAIIIAYVLISPYKIGADSPARPMSVLNVLFTVIFLSSCFFAAFMYGKRQNKSGFIGLIGIWALFYIALLIAGIPEEFMPIVYQILSVIIFGYATLFLITDFFFFFAPAIMIILIICFWYIGKKTGGSINVNSNKT